MNEKEMWHIYINTNDVKNKIYDAWSFGGGPSMANELATLVLNGVKTATASV